MGKVKALVTEICELYDFQGKSIREIADWLEMSDDEVVEVLSQYSDAFNPIQS